MEQRYLNQYDDSESEVSVDETKDLEDLENLNLEENDDLYCVACNKFFNSTSAQENHELSKKHKQNVEIIKKSMNAEEEHFQKTKLEEESERSSEVSELAVEKPKKKKSKKKNKVQVNYESDNELPLENGKKSDPDVDEEVEEAKSSKKKKSKKKNTIQISYDSEPEVVDNVEELQSANEKAVEKGSEDENWDNKKGKKSKVKKVKPKTDAPKVEKDSSESEEAPTTSKKTNSKRPSKKKIDTDAEVFDIETTCVTCKKNCGSKNKLFAHLKETNHGVYLDKAKKVDKVEKSKKKK